MLQLISSYLPNKDIKNLRLAIQRLDGTSTLRIERIFISPSYKNIEVLHAIIGHAEFREKVKEIVWDDARFQKYLLFDEESEKDELDEFHPTSYRMFEPAYEDNLGWVEQSVAGLVRARTGAYPTHGEEMMTLDENFALYRQYYEEQQEIITAGLDVEALRAALSSFPALERLTVTSEAHRPGIHAPRYTTPMIRSFPPSFNYPVAWPWHGQGDVETEGYDSMQPWSEAREHWRGFYVLVEELARSQKIVPELVVDVNRELTGIAFQFFEAESSDSRHFETICKRGLTRLDLAVNVAQRLRTRGQEVLRHSSSFKRALSTAASMKHFSLHLSTATKSSYNESFDSFEEHTGILDIIPIDTWRCLEHLSFSHLPLDASSLLTFPKNLPPSFNSLEFHDVLLFKGDWACMLQQLKDVLHWTSNNPAITISVSQMDEPYQSVWIQDEIARYLDGGHSPFIRQYKPSEIQWGFGTIRDYFDESFSEPWGPSRALHVQVSPGIWQERQPVVLLDDGNL